MAEATVKESSQRWAKAASSDEKTAAGRECIAAATELCRSLQGCKRVEQKARLLAYPLANAAKMHEAASFGLFEAFGTVLYAAHTATRTSSAPSSSGSGGGGENLAKCCSHFCQGISQHAMKMCKQDGNKPDMLMQIASFVEYTLHEFMAMQ
jgi:hypothetical protein